MKKFDKIKECGIFYPAREDRVKFVSEKKFGKKRFVFNNYVCLFGVLHYTSVLYCLMSIKYCGDSPCSRVLYIL